ncbi:MAG: DUF4126 domain-containing protein [Chlorobi bacterium CHB2]|nr:DUF4126 domain-containing protein [Chlorobi bacterium CHB2]
MPESVISIALGLGLSAACGFRVFLPLLAMSIAAATGQLSLGSGFAWVGTTPALIALATATAAEVLAYYIPWFDNLLDTIATPAAMVAGVVASAGAMVDLPEFIRWGLAVVAGGGAATVVQGTTVALRAKSSATTAGVGNPFLATAELAGAVTISTMALVVPVVTLLLVVLLIVLLIRAAGRLLFRRKPATEASSISHNTIRR